MKLFETDSKFIQGWCDRETFTIGNSSDNSSEISSDDSFEDCTFFWINEKIDESRHGFILTPPPTYESLFVNSSRGPSEDSSKDLIEFSSESSSDDSSVDLIKFSSESSSDNSSVN